MKPTPVRFKDRPTQEAESRRCPWHLASIKVCWLKNHGLLTCTVRRRRGTPTSRKSAGASPQPGVDFWLEC